MTPPGKYDPTEVEVLHEWVRLVAKLILLEPEQNAKRLNAGLDRLTVEAERLYPELEAGVKVGMDTSDLGPEWDPDDDVGGLFVELTGTLLFIGVDGPRPTSAALHRTIDTIRKEIDNASSNDTTPA